MQTLYTLSLYPKVNFILIAVLSPVLDLVQTLDVVQNLFGTGATPDPSYTFFGAGYCRAP